MPIQLSKEQLTLELESAKIENALMKQNLDQLNKEIERLFIVYGVYTDGLMKPHYLTNKELNIFKNKGIEALFLAWQKEIQKIDKEGKKKYDFDLPTKK